jgi:murein lipoprotein
MKNTLIKASLVAAVLTLAAGCASNSELAKVRATAEGAQNSADRATAMAQAAQSTADQAMQTANEANMKATEANTKIDRSFKKSMYK